MNIHHITILKVHALAEAEAVRAIKMHVHVAGTPMRIELEVMMLDVHQVVTHRDFAGRDRILPHSMSRALDRHLSGHCLKVAADNELWPNRAGAKLGACEIEIVRALELVVREFVACGHADAIWTATI